MITGVDQVVLRVTDQESAKRFWTQQVGLDCVQDATVGDERWVQVRSPAGGPSIALVTGGSTRRPDDGPPDLPTSGVFFECDDLVVTHAELSSRGVTFSQPPVERFFGWWAVFEDPDGQRHALRQGDDERGAGRGQASRRRGAGR